MIHKIERLTSIGKFRSYTASGQVNFHKLTLIYGDNGSGKTTLTSVIRSATTNDPQIVISRASTNATVNQAAQIVEAGTPPIHHTLRTTGWSVPLDNVEIFDIHFINDNIYSGFDFGDGQRKQLHKFVIGDQGVAIQQQIEANKDSKTVSRTLQTSLEQQILTAVANNLTAGAMLNDLVALQTASAVNIAQSIAAADASLTTARANATIQTLPNLQQLSDIQRGIDFDTLKADLQLTTAIIGDQALKTLFAEHCADLAANNLQNPERWLESGFRYVEHKNHRNTDEQISCPFCTQEISTSLDLFRAYNTLFNEDFGALTERIQTHTNDLQSFNLAATLQALQSTNQNNVTAIASWVAHLPSTVQPPSFAFMPDEQVLQIELGRVIAAVNYKAQNPSTVVAIECVEEFERSLAAISAGITQYNAEVVAYNAGIATFKTGIQTIAQAEAELNRMRRIERRFDPAVNTLCVQLAAERTNLRTLEQQYTALSASQDTLASSFLATYSTQINHYLGTVFKTSFQIADVVHLPPRGQARESKVGYKLTIDGLDISFDEGQPFSARECLSEGDKSTIALAFFLAKLDNDPHRADKILVFDDPLSSLDTNRRTYTVRLIKNLFQHMKQVIVLSHNEHFLHEIGDGFGAAQKKTLRVTENFAARASILEVCDLDDLVKNTYFKHIEELESFRTHPDHSKKDTVLGWLRNVLEAHLRFKFYHDLRTMTHTQTFGSLITHLEAEPVVFRDGNKAQVISDLRLINSVSWRPHHGDPSPDFASLSVNPHTMTASELDNMIVETLTLINDRL
ncbi:MAG: hypothetical protein CFE23_10380 [Flavobacterium sp. BFFFF1]|uniref:AAA family ATPase n=1 Tax=Flavobacterium sp. BFFFF1 TaxID=2015557 RepID=UPI000BD2A345|nr:AAA family ATPase [Flavobacterium sp. BFFFF1]OYU80299.1 MAG: hypothetical protein CFE23_10380 [Flavobacterium sp. BFFFF1]